MPFILALCHPSTGRHILDGVLIANEVVDGWFKSKKSGLLLKIDLTQPSTTLLAINTPSRIFLPPRKTDCVSPMIMGMTFLSLDARTLERILYIEPTKLIGLNSLKVIALSSFGIKAMKVLFKPDSNMPLT